MEKYESRQTQTQTTQTGCGQVSTKRKRSASVTVFESGILLKQAEKRVRFWMDILVETVYHVRHSNLNTV